MGQKRRSNEFLRKVGGNIKACLNNKGGSRGSRAKKRISQNVFYHKKKNRKNDSETFPTPTIFVLFHFVFFEDSCIKKQR